MGERTAGEGLQRNGLQGQRGKCKRSSGQRELQRRNVGGRRRWVRQSTGFEMVRESLRGSNCWSAKRWTHVLRRGAQTSVQRNVFEEDGEGRGN